MQVAIQGIKGCFHEIAAHKYFGEREPINTVDCKTFTELFRTFQKDSNYYGVLAIENTVAGTILPNYALLRNSPTAIIGEVYLRIQHNLVALNDCSINHLQEVHSHPMAILQCQDFFKQYPHIQLIESQDTALSAKQLQDYQLETTAAIASSLAAEHYCLEILAEGIETNKQNYTRFLVLQHQEVVSPNGHVPNKASICFNLSHQVGSLVGVLNILADYGINLSKIQSLPIVGQVWEYFFHVDVEFRNYDTYKKSLEAIKPYINQFKILGEYRVGIKHRTI